MKKHDCDIYIFQPINDDMYLQLVRKSTLSQFDDEGCYEKKIDSIPSE